jgi:AraC-like DNA-binding protein
VQHDGARLTRRESSNTRRGTADDTVFIANLYRLFSRVGLDRLRRAAYTEATLRVFLESKVTMHGASTSSLNLVSWEGALGVVAPATTHAAPVVRAPDSWDRLGIQVNERALDYYQPLRRIKAYVEQNFAETITLERAARVAGLEKKYLSALFHRKVGIAFKRWVSAVRIREALRLMAEADHSITDIAFTVGFGDIRTFERCFKRCLGATPREMKKRISP